MKKWALMCAALLVLAGCSVSPGRESPPPSGGPLTPTPGVSATGALPDLTATPVPSPNETVVTPAVTPAPVFSHTPETVPEPSPTPVVWNGDPATLTLADFPTVLATSHSLGDPSTPLQLVAELPEQDTYLYGFTSGQGLVLRVGDTWQFFDLHYLTPRKVAPVISYGDYDSDMELELSMVLYVGSGTEVSLEELHIIEFSASGVWEDLSFSNDDCGSILSQSLSSAYDASIPAVVVRAGDSSVTWSDFIPEEQGEFQGVVHLPSTLYFYALDDTIVMSSPIGVLYSDHVSPLPIGSINATVVYTGSTFGLTDLVLALDSDA